MPAHFDDLSPLSSRQTPTWLSIALFVIMIHAGLLAIGTYWDPTPPKPKAQSKIMVQTVRLHSLKSATSQIPPPTPSSIPLQEQTSPVEPPAEPPVAESLNNPLPISQNTTSSRTEESIEKIASSKISKQDIPSPSPSVTPSIENKPQKKEIPTKAKATVPDTKKTKPTKSTTPSNKSKEPAKNVNKAETAKATKSADEAKQKRQKEQAEEEKKRRQEQEIEKKRQQELAAAQAAARQREQALFTKAKENLAKMGETRDKISSSSSSINLEATNLPKEIGNLQVDALPVGEVESTGDLGIKEISYSQEVAYRLKMTLRLPDYGAVKIKLTLDRTGKVIKVETLQSESKKNKVYVENKIPPILFSSFGQRFQGFNQKTFEITLQNES